MEEVKNIKLGIWYFGIASWVFGLTDRTLAALSDGYLSATDLTLLFTAGAFFLGWLSLKPGKR